jgi:hypothetical protein
MLRIETLNQTHKRKYFDCGNELLNQYLQKMARQHAVKGIARTTVFLVPKLCFTAINLTAFAANCPRRTVHRKEFLMKSKKVYNNQIVSK